MLFGFTKLENLGRAANSTRVNITDFLKDPCAQQAEKLLARPQRQKNLLHSSATTPNSSRYRHTSIDRSEAIHHI
jgi:hypothetical protein